MPLLTPPSPQPRRIKRKPAPSICGDLEARYPPPDPSDPLASLASLRARNRTNQPLENGTHVLDCDVHIASPDATLSAWYEVYPSSPLDFGYLPSHPYRVSSIKKLPVSNKGPEEKRTSHYRPRSLSLAQQPETYKVEQLPTSRSLPPLTFDSDDASSESKGSDDASLRTSADHCPSSRSSMSSHHFHETPPPAKHAMETIKARRRLSKRSSLASSSLSYSTAPATLPSDLEKNEALNAASNRSHPFAHSSLSLRVSHAPRRISGDVANTPLRYRVETLPTTRTPSSGSLASYVHVLNPSMPSYAYDARSLSPVDERPQAIGIPSIPDLSYAATCYVVAENGVRVAFSDLCASPTTIVCFIRHFWCSASQDYVASLCKQVDAEALNRTGSRLVIIGNGSPHMIRAYKRMFHLPFDLYSDPSQRLYEALGLGRVAREHHHHHSHRRVRLFLRAIRAGMPVWGKGGDPEQLGGEFVFRHSVLRCSFAHRMTQVGDHTPIPQLFKSAGLCSALRDPPRSVSVCEQGQRPPLRKARSSFLQMTEASEGRTLHASL